MIELVPSGTHIDFIGKRRICAALSLGLILLAIGAGVTRGVNFGIDFAGGTEMQLRFSGEAPSDEAAIRGVVSGCGIGDATVVVFGSEREYLLRFGAPSEEMVNGLLRSEACPITASERERVLSLRSEDDAPDLTGQVKSGLGFAISNGVAPVEVDRLEFVGPRVGAELRRDGLKALGIATLLILIYVAFRFSTRFAPGAIVAVVHDIAITAGIFVIFGLEFDLKVLAALLAIIGYSLNDTIIIYDRIRENMEIRTTKMLEETLNLSVNQTLSRTVLTSGTTLAAVLSLLFLGGEVVRPFALAMAIGIVVGTYSSVFIAAPTLLWLEQRYAKSS